MTTARKRALAAPIAVATAIGLAACSDDSAGPEAGASVEDVVESDPDENDDTEWLGKTVTVSGEATEVVNPSAFRIGGDDLGGDSVLVVSSTADFTEMGADVSEDAVDADTVFQVTGTVREMEVASLEDEYGVDYDDAAFDEFEGENVIVADQVSTLAGETLTMAGEVSNIVSTVAFQLAGSGWTVVVMDAEQATVDEGEYLQVQGIVRQLNIAELEEEFGDDLDDALYEQYEGDLVLVAQDVSPVEAVTPSPSE